MAPELEEVQPVRRLTIIANCWKCSRNDFKVEYEIERGEIKTLHLVCSNCKDRVQIV